MMDRVDNFFRKLIKAATIKCEVGDELFEKYDVPYNASGLVVRKYFTYLKYKGKHFIVGWNIETDDGNNPRGIRGLASPYIQSYLVFKDQASCNKVLMYYEERGRLVYR